MDMANWRNSHITALQTLCRIVHHRSVIIP